LGGKGIETKAITETFGAYGSGKCVSKDTPVCYFNDTRMHVESIEATYNKYNKNKEISVDDGFAVPTSSVKVMAWHNGTLQVVPTSCLYKEKVKKLYLIKTRRGRQLKVTAKHGLLGFDNGVNWKKARDLRKGDLIASPKKLDLETEKEYNEEDAYFLGMFVAEGTSNPFSISTGNVAIKDWICSYIKKKFNYLPRVREDNRREKTCYTILLRNQTKAMMEGLDKCNASSKFIPEAIFLSSESVVSSFLGGYLDGDGEISKSDVSVTTKSKKLATQLTYLLLRLGIASSLKERRSNGMFYVVRISGEDRESVREILYKIKHFNPNTRNSAYGYPKQIITFLSKLYTESIGGNRGRLRKEVGKRAIKRTIYSNLINNYNAKVINTKTLEGIENIFENQKQVFSDILKRLDRRLDNEILKEIYPNLPFAFNSLADKMGLKKSSLRNYYSRNLPKDKAELLRNLIVNELRIRIDVICLALEVIAEIKLFSWDIVDSIEEIEYDDYVYDFVVPKGHSFIGGNMPTMMHNTQLALSLAVTVQLPKDKGGVNGKAVYIDTEGTFRPERVRQFAEGLGANSDKVLKNIFVARAFNSDHQILLLDKIAEMIKDGEPIKLLIVDSLTAHFRAEYSGRGQLADRQQRLNRYLHQMMRLADQYNIAVYVTNQVMANPAMMFGDPTTAIGGNIVGHACTYRMYLRRGKKDTRVAKLIDSPNLPDGETVFSIETDGLKDVKV
ncbi:MAG: DNA repair and recombination protein RadA, partial [Candidatus Nanoarchaeia archaeon]